MNIIKENSTKITLLSHMDWNELAVEARAGNKVSCYFHQKSYCTSRFGILKILA